VDLLIERANGDLLGIEVKATATPRPRDATGLKLLRDKLGGRFRNGFVLHLGPSLIPMGDKISSIPLATLWA